MEHPKKYGIQVRIDGHWIWIAPVNGQPYKYDTEDEAKSMMHICYPDQVREAKFGGEKVVRVKVFS